MSRFVRRWANWGESSHRQDPGFDSETQAPGTDNTDKGPFGSVVSDPDERFELKGALAGGVSEVAPSLLVADVLAMHLSDFARASLVVEVRSAALGEVVVFASDNAQVDPGEQRVVYRAAELRELLGLSARDLRAVHRVKRTFRGTVLS